jgi:hypothetical protein
LIGVSPLHTPHRMCPHVMDILFHLVFFRST